MLTSSPWMVSLTLWGCWYCSYSTSYWIFSSLLLNVNKQVSIFNNKFFNICKNFIRHDTITCDKKSLDLLKSKVFFLSRVFYSGLSKGCVEKKTVKEKNTYKNLLQKKINVNISQKFNASKSKLQNLLEFSEANITKRFYEKYLILEQTRSVIQIFRKLS